MATPIIVKKNNGSILSAAGGRNEKGNWGKVDRWWDYFGPIDNRDVGIMIMSGPGNPPVWAHSRDYGALVANPFPVDRKENRGKKVVVKAGETFRLRYGVLIHEHAAGQAFDREAAYARYSKSIR